MSDYVTRLAAKSLDKLDVVKPRLATMFEPPRVSGGLMSGRSFDADRLASEPASDQAVSDRPAPPARLNQHWQMERPLIERTRDHRTQEPIGDIPTMTHLPPTPQPVIQSPRVSLPDSSDPPQRETGPATSPQQSIRTEHEHPARQPEPVRMQPAAHHAPTAPAQLASSAAMQPALKQHTTLTLAEEKNGNSLQPMTAQPSSQEQPTPLSASSRSEAVTAPPGHVEKRQRSPAPQAADQPTTVKAQPSSSSQLEPAVIHAVRPSPEGKVIAQPHRLRPALAQKAAPEPAPTIHVTIGRVEVRATTSSAQPLARQRTADPRMSLEEYLRQRSGGGGR